MAFPSRFQVDAKGGLTKKLFEIGYRRRLSAVNGSWFGAYGLEKILWNFIVFRKVLAILGGQIRLVLSGAAPLSAVCRCTMIHHHMSWVSIIFAFMSGIICHFSHQQIPDDYVDSEC